MAFDIYQVFDFWGKIGGFDIILPFLLVFALVFGILSATNILGRNKGVHVIIAFVIGMLSLRFGIFAAFLNQIAPRLAIGLSVIIALVILVGMFLPTDEKSKKIWMWILAGVGAVIAIVVVYQSFDGSGWIGGVGSDTVGFIVGGVLLVALVVGLIIGSKE